MQNWQWVARSGADAGPYFCIFNPITQGRNFDADGRYVRRCAPDRRALRAARTAPPQVLGDADVRLGAGYPRPIFDHDFAGKRALDAFASIAEARGPEGD